MTHQNRDLSYIFAGEHMHTQHTRTQAKFAELKKSKSCLPRTPFRTKQFRRNEWEKWTESGTQIR